MAFDWLAFFDQNRIPYRTQGPNTSRDNCVIHCPFCGAADQSEHLSVNLLGKGFRCWRDPTHRGKAASHLVARLLNIDSNRAKAIVGEAIFIPDDFNDRVRSIIAPPPAVARKALTLPPEFRAFMGQPSSRPFIGYLLRRGFTQQQINTLTARYGVRYCTQGSYRRRILFPIRYKGELVAWTGRTIDADHDLRYKALSTDAERTEREGYEPALGAISHYLLWYDELRESRADTLLFVEGPFDALKVRVLGRAHGITATCFFTSSPTDEQIALMHGLVPKFRYRFALLDRGTFKTGIRLAQSLSTLGIGTLQLPPQLKDPGEFTVSTFDEFVLTL